MNDNSNKKVNLIKFGQLIYKWKKLLIISFIGLSVFAVTYSLIIPKTFSTSATILPPTGTSILSSFLPQEMTRGLGGALGSALQGQTQGANKILSILYSRDLAINTIKEFDLRERWEQQVMEDAINSFRSQMPVEVDNEGMVRVSANVKTDYFHPDANEDSTRKLAKKIADYIVHQLDKKYTKLESQKAQYEREVIKKRYQKNKEDLREAEQALKQFQQKYGIIALPEQIKASAEAAAQLKSKIIINQIQLEALQKTFSSSRPEIRQKKITINELKNKLGDFKFTGLEETDSLTIFPSFQNSPDLALRYGRLQRDLEVQNIIYKFLTQQNEQMKLRAAKETPTIQLIDDPRTPTKRSSPTRSLLCIVIVSAGMFFVLLLISLYEYYQKHFSDLIEEIKKSD